MSKVIVLFTAKEIDRILQEGGTCSWRLDRNKARQCEYAVCTRNANADWVEGPEEHHAAFLVGKVKDVVPALLSEKEGRYLIHFSEYAHVSIPEVWKGDRNPVKYADGLQELGIDPASLKWKKMPEVQAAPAKPPEAKGLTITEAKKGLAQTYGVAPEAVEITIRG